MKNISVAFNHPKHFENRGRCETQTLSWQELLAELEVPVEVASTEDDEKAKAGFVSLARYETTRRQAKFVEAVTAIGLDVDDRCPDLEVLERRMRALGWSAAIYETVSSSSEKRKVRIIIEMQAELTADTMDAAGRKALSARLSAVQRAAAALLGVVPDKACVGDTARIFYRPCHTPGQKIYFAKFEGDQVDAEQLGRLGVIRKIDFKATAEKAGLVGDDNLNGNGNWELEECPFADAHSDPKNMRGGAFVGQHFAVHCDHNTCKNSSEAEEPSGYQTRGFLFRMVLQGRIAEADIVEEREPTIEELVASGEPFGLMKQAEDLLDQMGERLRYNEFSLLPEIWTDSGKSLLSDGKEMILRQMWPLAFDGAAPPSEEMHRALLTLGTEFRSYHPVREYLDGLEWDGVERLDTWLVEACGAPDRADVRAMGAKFLVGAVKRIYEPGCQFDQMLVLVGPQGTRKSTTVRALCPNPEWFSESVELGTSPKQTIEQMSGIWIAEVAEMVGNSKREVDAIKHAITRKQDRARLSYAKNVTIMLRQGVMIGTSNDDELLRDPTGARRFWLVEVDQCRPERVLEMRDQLFAEAKARMATEKLWIDHEDGEAFRLMSEVHQQYADNGPYYDMLREHLKRENASWIRAAAVWRLIGIQDEGINRANNTMKANVRRAMSALGYERRTVKWTNSDGRSERVKGWVWNPNGVPTNEMNELYTQSVQGKVVVFETSWGEKKLKRK